MLDFWQILTLVQNVSQSPQMFPGIAAVQAGFIRCALHSKLLSQILSRDAIRLFGSESLNVMSSAFVQPEFYVRLFCANITAMLSYSMSRSSPIEDDKCCLSPLFAVWVGAAH